MNSVDFHTTIQNISAKSIELRNGQLRILLFASSEKQGKNANSNSKSYKKMERY